MRRCRGRRTRRRPARRGATAPAPRAPRRSTPCREVAEWLDRGGRSSESGARAEVGLPREHWWADVCARLRTGACLAIDYGHLLARPTAAWAASRRIGRPSVPGGVRGDRDITADVAVDALAGPVGGPCVDRLIALLALGITRSVDRRSAGQQRSAPRTCTALSQVGEVAELTASPGLGDFWWLLSWSQWCPRRHGSMTSMGATEAADRRAGRGRDRLRRT